MTVTERLSLVPGVASVTAPDGSAYLLRGTHRQSLGQLDGSARALLGRLAAGPCRPTSDDLLARLRAGGWLASLVADGQGPRYRLRPVRRPAPTERTDGAVTLSRFALVRAVDGQLVVQSPAAWCELDVYHEDVAAALAVLAGPATAERLEKLMPRATVRRLLSDLGRAGLVVKPGGAEDTDLRRCQWSPHELWFHEHSRIGLHQQPQPVGATFWAQGRFEPPAAHRGAHPGPAVPLPVPDPEAVRAADPPFTDVAQARRSLREHDDRAPLRLAQLAEFLHRAGAVRATLPGAGGEQIDRVVPGAGAAHELEFYLVVRAVTGLSPGLYHYEAHEHRLRRVAVETAPVRRLLADARAGAEMNRPPQVLIVLAARFARLMWKYQAVSYALVLKDVGVLLHHMYLVATAMRLAPCALGTGDSAAFAEATGLDPLEECSVGEFVLGSRVGS